MSLWLFRWFFSQVFQVHIFIFVHILFFFFKIFTVSSLSHGLVITLPFCFLNTEVQAVVKTHWRRWRMVSLDFDQTRVKALLLVLFKTGWDLNDVVAHIIQISTLFIWVYMAIPDKSGVNSDGSWKRDLGTRFVLEIGYITASARV